MLLYHYLCLEILSNIETKYTKKTFTLSSRLAWRTNPSTHHFLHGVQQNKKEEEEEPELSRKAKQQQRDDGSLFSSPYFHDVEKKQKTVYREEVEHCL